MDLNCLKCGKPMLLLQEGFVNYSWQCPDKCLLPVDTGVNATKDITNFQKSLSNSFPHLQVVTPPLSSSQITGAKAYAPQVFIHFIECTWAGCYNSIYQLFIVPHFDSAPVLDYVLRTPVVSGETVMENGIPAPKMYPELLHRLRGVKSANIQKYLDERFANWAS